MGGKPVRFIRKDDEIYEDIFIPEEGKTYMPLNHPWKNAKPKKDWRDELKANDILITKSGDLRVIRDAVYFRDGILRSVILAIRKCSWTRSSTTMYSRADLKTLKFRKAFVKFKPTEADDKFQEFVRKERRNPSTCRNYTCIDAKSFA
jgi:hypothetical protein